MSALNNTSLQDFLDSQPQGEISWIFSRYCGSSNRLLFEREFAHFGVRHVEFEREIKRRLFIDLLEDTLLNP